MPSVLNPGWLLGRLGQRAVILAWALLFSTLLSLFLVPVMFTLLARRVEANDAPGAPRPGPGGAA